MTNYATKSDSSHYQRAIRAAFVWKKYEEVYQQNTIDDPSVGVQTGNIDKFALRAFNRLLYDREISRPLAANILLALPKYYTPEKTIKKVNLWALRRRFSKIIFGRSTDEDVAENFVLFGKSREMPTSKFDDYN